ncbi:MAG: ion transporter [Candidatus Ozemobacteraceae bacterium]
MGQSYSIEETAGHPERRRFPGIRALVTHGAFDGCVIILILLSIFLLVIETLDFFGPAYIPLLDFTNEILTFIFVAELSLRWLVSRTNKRFFSEYWLDILSLLPLFRVFRLGRVFRLVRVLRMFSIAMTMQRRVTVFGWVVEGRAFEAFILSGFMVSALLFGTIGFAHFEVGPTKDLKTPIDAFWKALFTLLSNQYADYPESIGGRFILATMSVLGVSVFAMLTGTISAVMIEKLKERAMQSNISPDELQGHIVICGFSSKAAILIREFSQDPHTRELDIVLVSTLVDLEMLRGEKVPTDRILVIREDFTRLETLRKAAVDRARTAIILSESGEHRSTEDIDARTMLTALSIEKLNPSVRTCAEMYHAEYTDHLKSGGVDSVVIQGEVSGALLAHVALDEGTLPFFRDLLSPGHKNELTFVKVPTELIGKSMNDATSWMHKHHRSVVVGIKSQGVALEVNPPDRQITRDDRLMIIKPHI